MSNDFLFLINDYLAKKALASREELACACSRPALLLFLNDEFLPALSRFDALLKRCAKHLTPLKTNIVVHEPSIPQDKMRQIREEKRSQNYHIRQLCKLALQHNHPDVSAAVYLLVTQIIEKQHEITSYRVELFTHLDGGLKEEIKYLLKTLT